MKALADDIRTVNLPSVRSANRWSCTRPRPSLDLQPLANILNAAKACLWVHVSVGNMNSWIGRQRLLLPGAEGIAANPVWTSNPDPCALCQRLGLAARERLCGARSGLGRGDGGLRPGRHVRRGGDRPAHPEEAIANAERRLSRATADPTRGRGFRIPPGPIRDPPLQRMPACRTRSGPERAQTASDAHAPGGCGRLSKPPGNGLGVLFMLPAARSSVVLSDLSLGLGVWLGFTDTRTHRARGRLHRAGELHAWLADDPVFWLAVFNTVFTPPSPRWRNSPLGLWLALILNRHLPFKNFFRAIILLPWVVPTVLSAMLAFWWIFDSQFSIISWSLMQLGLISARPINFSGRSLERAGR